MHPKIYVLIFLIYMAKKTSFEVKSSVIILLASLVFSWFHFLFSLVFTLNFWQAWLQWRREGVLNLLKLLWLYLFLYMLMKHVMDIQTLFSQEKWKKSAILNLVHESMAHRDRSIWNQEQIHRFIDRFFVSYMDGKKI